jgi:hypothetical protein
LPVAEDPLVVTLKGRTRPVLEQLVGEQAARGLVVG